MTRALGGLALAGLLLAGCSAGGDSGASTADLAQGGSERAVGGAGSDAGGAGADAGAAAGGDAGAAAGDAAGSAEAGAAEAGAQDASGDVASGTGGVGLTAADAGGRQVITTGEAGLVSPDPRAAADAVVAQVEAAGGRVDARHETAARADEGTEATADLTVRVPAGAMTGLLEALDEIGDVDHVDLSSDDVTGAAQDLDARIHAMTLSVARMEDLLNRASTRQEVLEAEGTLTERQASLESLQSERARMAEQVALSTLRISIWTPPQPAPADETAPAEPEGPPGFLGGLAAGWSALLGVLGVVVTVLGVLLPWLVLGAAVLAAVLWARRSLRRRATATGGAAGAAGAAG
ncbi:DUF4349 domain-containing protein, partial [Cellulomonas sp. IC4_254]|uniref:DUF4349 domain-containing protein n=1 Tax=Cellulomonas sp. IC4_254 TaxID=2714040 RepID=UPI00141E6A3E|nr:DUF4349 domain-containing protein [Cellulomonas sp. IC4_254]